MQMLQSKVVSTSSLPVHRTPFKLIATSLIVMQLLLQAMRVYSGRFDLYQRTYACTLFENINPDYIFPLYWFVKLELSKKIMGGTRGSAIPYIVMNDLAKFEFIYNEETFTTYMPIFKSLTESIQANEFENECLAKIRDALLPRLMSGELDVSSLDI